MLPVALVLAELPAGALAAAPADPALIPRAAIFGNPERAGAQISPDGKYISFLAPRDGVLNVWAVERGKALADARPLTREKVRPIRTYYWAANGNDIVYAQDKDGDENYLLYAVNVASGTERKLTDFKGVRVVVYGSSWKRPDELLIGINDRDKAFHDPYLLNVRTGDIKKLFNNTEKFDGFITDEDLRIRFVTRATDEGGQEVFRFADGKSTPFETIGFEDSQTTGPSGLTRDGKTLYWSESRGRNTAALLAIDLATGKKKVIGEDSRADVGGEVRDPATGVIQAYGVNYLKNEWRAVDPAVKADIDFLNSNLKGQWAVQSQTQANNIWLIGNDPITSPPRVMVYDRAGKNLTELYVGRPALSGVTLPAVCPVEIKARDGLNLVAYLTLPVGSDKDADCKPDRPLPMVLNVHGGPWHRDTLGTTPRASGSPTGATRRCR